MAGDARPWQPLGEGGAHEKEKSQRRSSSSDIAAAETVDNVAIKMDTIASARRPGATEPGLGTTAYAVGGAAAAAARDDEAAAGATTDQQQPQYRTYKRRWFGLLQLTLLNIIVSWDWLTFAPVASHAAAYFNTSETVINWLSTAFMFSFTFATPAVIYLLHLGPKPSIATSAGLVLVGNWIRYAGSHSTSGGKVGVVMFGQILTGFAQALVLPAPARYSDLWFTHRGRVAATALSSLANPLGGALGQLIVPFWVNEPSDVPRMVLYMSIISSVCSIPAFFIPSAPPTPAGPSSATPKLTLRESASALMRHLEFYLLLTPFAVYVGLFNSLSSLLNQILLPYAFTDEEAGIAGALLIAVGLVAAAVSSPVIDRTKSFLLAVRVAVPLIAASYLAFVWMPATRSVAGPYAVMALLGAASFSLVPVAVEYLVELTHPVSPAVTAVLAWSAGQLLGGVFIVICGELKATGPEADPPGNMHSALVFHAVLALVAAVPPLCLGLFGRGDKIKLRRVVADEAGSASGISSVVEEEEGKGK
ncbi:hypothetical protein VTJ04DRAFT_6557 [Mycothermus thermophilus]|uniref:uncharacterized protein n=1 Tax=Humicola insolens TaxID=85995 RepID=UPI0037449462